MHRQKAPRRKDTEEVKLPQPRYGLGVSWQQHSDKVVDIDLQAVVVDIHGTIIDAVYYNNLKALKAITHSGDETSGGKISEVIWVSLTKLPEHVKLILFVVAAHSGGHLRDVKNGCLHLLEERKDNEVGRFSMEQSSSNVDAVAMMVRSSNAWTLLVIDEPAQDGQHFIDILEPTLGNIIRAQIPGAPARQKVAFAMQKGTVVDLPESDVIGVLSAGVGWDISPSVGKEVDLDVSAICFTNGGKCHGAVFFGNEVEFGLQHSGDNLTGEGEGDDETISADLQAIPEDVQQIVFVVNIYTDDVSFEQVRNAYCRIYDRSGTELARYILLEGTGRRGLVIARLFREHGTRWAFQALGQFCRGKTWKDAVEDIAPIVRMSAQALQEQGVSTISVGRKDGPDSPLAADSAHWRSPSSPSAATASQPPQKSSMCTVS